MNRTNGIDDTVYGARTPERTTITDVTKYILPQDEHINRASFARQRASETMTAVSFEQDSMCKETSFTS